MKIKYKGKVIEMKHIAVIKLIILKELWNGRFGQHASNSYFFHTEWYCVKLDQWRETRLR